MSGPARLMAAQKMGKKWRSKKKENGNVPHDQEGDEEGAPKVEADHVDAESADSAESADENDHDLSDENGLVIVLLYVERSFEDLSCFWEGSFRALLTYKM